MNNGTRELEYLLNHYWVVKEENPELYFKIKNSLDSFAYFIQNKLGSKLIVNSRFIKLEKIPAVAKPYMGIREFTDKLEYIILFIVLIFLEDKPKGEQFILSNLIDFITNTAISLELDNLPNWNLARHRKCLLVVIYYLKDMNIIKIVEEQNNFTDDKSAEALYETTALSNFLVREFKNNILEFNTINDYINDESIEQNENKGDIRRYKVYRNLVYSLVSYTDDLTEFEMDYLKKFRSTIKNEIEKYTQSELELTKNMALLLYDDETKEKFDFPNNKAISDIILLINNDMVKLIATGEVELENDETFVLSNDKLSRIIKNVKLENQDYFSKYYKDMLFHKFFEEVVDYMQQYDLIRIQKDGYKIYPMINRMIGYLNKSEITDVSKQLSLLEEV